MLEITNNYYSKMQTSCYIEYCIVDHRKTQTPPYPEIQTEFCYLNEMCMLSQLAYLGSLTTKLGSRNTILLASNDLYLNSFQK